VLVGMRRGSGADEGKGEGRADGAGNGGMGSTASPRAPAFTAAPPQTPHRSGDGTGHGWRRRRNGAQEDGWGRGDVGGPAGI
jgi:hypothetical protein